VAGVGVDQAAFDALAVRFLQREPGDQVFDRPAHVITSPWYQERCLSFLLAIKPEAGVHERCARHMIATSPSGTATGKGGESSSPMTYKTLRWRKAKPSGAM